MAETSDLPAGGIPFDARDIVSGLEPGELVEIQAIRPFGSKQLVEAVGPDTDRPIRRPPGAEELQRRVQYVVQQEQWVAHGEDVA